MIIYLRTIALMASIASALCVNARADDQVTTEKSFTVVLLPDTPFYAEKYPETYVAVRA